MRGHYSKDPTDAKERFSRRAARETVAIYKLATAGWAPRLPLSAADEVMVRSIAEAGLRTRPDLSKYGF